MDITGGKIGFTWWAWVLAIVFFPLTTLAVAVFFAHYGWYRWTQAKQRRLKRETHGTT